MFEASDVTTCIVYGWGLNEDGTTFGSAGLGLAPQFTVQTTIAPYASADRPATTGPQHPTRSCGPARRGFGT